MSVASFIEKIVGQQQQRIQRKVGGYRDLLAGIAAGDEPNPDEVERILADAGKSLEDLQFDVERQQHRIDLKAKVASMPKLDREIAEIQQQIAAADRTLEAAEKQHTETTWPLYGHLQALKESRSDASRAQQELFRSCDSSELNQQHDQANDELNRLLEVNRDLATQAAYLGSRADSERLRADRELTEADRDHRREQASLYQKQAESLRRQIKANEKAQADAIKHRDQVEDRMRQW